MKTDENFVRSLWLVGESLPLSKDHNNKIASKVNQLDEQLVPLDPRHGVFPNLVMKPLFAATFAAFKERESNAIALLRGFEAVVCDQPDRRFNLFQPKITDQKNAKSDNFDYDSDLQRRIQEYDFDSHLWLVFGHQTISGLLKWLLESKPTTTRNELKKFLEQFVKDAFSVAQDSNCSFTFPSDRPATATGRVGFVHRLCTEYDADENGASMVLRRVIEGRNKGHSYSTEVIVKMLRCVVPLMHNEAYQIGPHPIGNAQTHFVKYAVKTPVGGSLYWQAMGHSVARRCFNRWVGEPS